MISEKEVVHIATLARIHLEQDEIPVLKKDLESILDYIDQLEKLDVASVEPTSHILSLKNVSRKDAVQPSLKREEIMKFIVAHKKGGFLVPQVIES